MSGNLSWFRAVHRGAIAQFSGAAGFASPLVVSPVPLPVIVSAAVHDDVADDGRVPLLVETLQRLVVDVGRRGAGILLKKAAVHLALPLPTRREAASEPLRTPAAQVPLQEWARAFAMIDAGQSVTKTAKQCNMGFCTLWRRHNARDCGKRTPGPATVLGEKGEALLTNFLLMRQRIGNCVTMDEFRLTAKRIAAALSVEGFVAGKTWEANWWRRHPGLAREAKQALAAQKKDAMVHKRAAKAAAVEAKSVVPATGTSKASKRIERPRAVSDDERDRACAVRGSKRARVMRTSE